MIEATELTKRYGAKTAVDGLSFQVRPGISRARVHPVIFAYETGLVRASQR